MEQNAPKSVLVVGAGIIGLTTAICLREDKHEVIILCKETPSTFFRGETSALKGIKPSTYTSPASGGLWVPMRREDHKVREWSSKTFRRLEQEAGKGFGVEMVEGYTLHRDEEMKELPWFSELTPVTVETPTTDENVPATHKSAFRYKAPVVNMEEYMMHLEERAKNMGVKIHLTIEHSEQGEDWDWDLDRICMFASSQFGEKVTIVNCCGMGAEKLSGEKMIPGRGVSVKVTRPTGVNHFVVEGGKPMKVIETEKGQMDACLYCVPRGTEYVLGTSVDMGNEREDADISEGEMLVEKCAEILPSIRSAKVDTVRAGLRPFREDYAIRTGRQAGADAREMEMVANYGHGGLGVTLCWGCADEVARIISDTKEASNTWSGGFGVIDPDVFVSRGP